MACYVLVHGGFHGAWCWERIVPLLQAKGHRVVAPDLPGMGDDCTPFSDDPFAQWVDAITAQVKAMNAPVILVGHSLAGTIISQVAENVPDRIKCAVYLTAVLLPAAPLALPQSTTTSPLAFSFLKRSDDGEMAWIDSNAAGDLLYSKLSEDDRKVALARLRPQPTATLFPTLKLSNERFGSVAKIYIEATEDLVLPIEAQRRMQHAWPCKKIISLKSSHSPFYSMPEELTAALQDVY